MKRDSDIIWFFLCMAVMLVWWLTSGCAPKHESPIDESLEAVTRDVYYSETYKCRE